MKITCKKCSAALTKKEATQFLEEREYSQTEPACADCQEDEARQDHSFYYEQYSDADPGL